MNINTQWLLILAKRFVKVFISGGVAATVIFMAQHPLVDILEWKTFLTLFSTAFLAGGLGALEKWTQGWRP